MKRICNSSLGLCLLLSGSFAYAAESQPAAATAPAAAATAFLLPVIQFKGVGFAIPDLTAKQAEDEMPAIQFSWENRIRNESWNNSMDFSNAMDDQIVQMRYKEHAAFTYTSAPVDFMIGMDAELTKHMALNNAEVAVDSFSNAMNMTGEMIFEYFNLNLKKLFIPGLSMKVGRQDFMKGEGFLFMDGTSGDGSRSSYYNMVDISYKHAKSQLELVGILDPQIDRFLPVVHRNNIKKEYLNEWDEQAVGLYYADRNRKNTDIDAYYFLKKEIHERDYPNTSYQFQPDRHINTLGGRVVERAPRGFTFSGEYAAQWGAQHANTSTGTIKGTGVVNPVTGVFIPALSAAQPAKDIAAMGGSAYVNKSFNVGRWNPYLQVGYIGYSGSDYKNNPNKIGNFDPLFARWPHYSEMYLYSLVPEIGVGYWTNNNLTKLEVGMNPKIPHMKSFTIRGTVYDEYANHPFMPGAAALV